MSGTVRKNKVSPNGDADSSRLAAQALQFARYLRKWELSGRGWPLFRSITLYPPSASRNGSWLVVGKAYGEQEKLVAFHRSPDPLTALVGFLQKWLEGKLVWKVDEYREQDTWNP